MWEMVREVLVWKEGRGMGVGNGGCGRKGEVLVLGKVREVLVGKEGRGMGVGNGGCGRKGEVLGCGCEALGNGCGV